MTEDIKILCDKEDLVNIANAVRNKTGSTEEMTLDEIAFNIDNIPSSQSTPLFVDSIEECTDTTKLYVLPDGYIYSYMESETNETETVVDEIIGTDGNPYFSNSRFSNEGTLSTQSGYTVTPYIDLTKAEYQGKTIQIHLEGNRYASVSQVINVSPEKPRG